MRLSLAMVIALGGHAAASNEQFVVGVAGGVDIGDEPGVLLRLADGNVVKHPSGVVWGAVSGVDYWRGGDGTGFSILLGGFAGTRVGSVVSTLGAGAGLLAFEWTNDASTGGIAPYASATLGFEVTDSRMLTLDLRASRHVFFDTPDVMRWSLTLMWGTAIGR